MINPPIGIPLIRHAIIATKLDIYLGSVLKNQKEAVEADVKARAKVNTKAKREEMVVLKDRRDLFNATGAERKVTLLEIVLKKILDLKEDRKNKSIKESLRNSDVFTGLYEANLHQGI